MMIFDFLIPGEVGHVHATCGLINDTLGRKLQLWLPCENEKVYRIKNTTVLQHTYFYYKYENTVTVETKLVKFNKLRKTF